MHPTQTRLAVALVSVLLVGLPGALSVSSAEGEQAFIVKCTRPCAAVVATASLAGGDVTAVYDNIDAVAVRVPASAVPALAAAADAVFEVSWLQSWARYPTNDIDMILIDPLGNEVVDGATANSPERVTIANPTPGRWTAALIGFTVHGTRGHEDHLGHGPRKDVYAFRAEADGRRLRARR